MMLTLRGNSCMTVASCNLDCYIVYFMQQTLYLQIEQRRCEKYANDFVNQGHFVKSSCCFCYIVSKLCGTYDIENQEISRLVHIFSTTVFRFFPQDF